MKTPFLHIIFSLLCSVTVLAQKKNPIVELLNPKTTYTAGKDIKLCFAKIKEQQPTDLYCSNSYGSVLIKPIIQNNQIEYVFPKHISQKSGWVHWQLTKEQQHIKGNLYIQPATNVKHIEMYLGPPSLLAGTNTKGFAMLVVMPIDAYSNPVAKNTPINIQEKSMNSFKTNTLKFNGIIAHQKISAYLRSGKTFVSASCLNKTSKEHTLEIKPNAPTNFSIFANRVHQYADGNQIATFTSSTMKDVYGNVVADGTLVHFKITNKAGVFLQTYGTTTNGVATAQMIHPEHQDTWKTQAFVDGFAKSNILTLVYKSAIQNFDIQFSANNKTITAGIFKSYMNQVVPDGLVVQLSIYHQNKQIKSIYSEAEKGYAIFDVSTVLEKNKKYIVKITAAGINNQLEITNP